MCGSRRQRQGSGHILDKARGVTVVESSCAASPAAMLFCSISMTPSTLPAKMPSTLSALQHRLMISLLSFCSRPAMRSGVL